MDPRIDPRAALTDWRTTQKLTKTEVASRLGVSISIVSEWESGHRTPGRENATKLARLTGGAVPVEAWSSTDEGTADEALPHAVGH